MKHHEAEIACVHGDAAILAKYLRQPRPSPLVIKNLAWCLWADPTLSAECPENWKLGPGDWILRFASRNGRPPKKYKAPGAAFDSVVTAARALATGQAIPLARYLFAAPKPSRKILHGFAEALDSAGGSKWKLKFARPRQVRKRFRRSELQAVIRKAKIGSDALKLKEGDKKSWDEICRDLPYAETLIKEGIRLVRNARQTKPPA